MNDRLVSDTGPLIALAAIDRLDILPALFHQILIPEEVHREILQGGETALGLQPYRRATWIQKHPLQTSPDLLLAAVLDAGEAAVIQLARESHADYLLIDERKGRKIARNTYGLQVIGTAGLLVEAKNNGLVDSVGLILQQMRDCGYWIHDDIVAVALDKAGEI